jgi:glycosyltransferase involved in cell wall biosynthesis
MLMGVPTLANVYPDLLGRARLEDMRDIALLKNLDPEHIADRIRALMRDPSSRSRIGHGGRAFVKKHMAWSVVAGDYEQLLAPLRKGAT